jgi:hypothetical protein
MPLVRALHPCPRMAAISWESWRRRRWLPPLVALAVLCLASLAVAFVTARGRRSPGRLLDGIAATLSNIPHGAPSVTLAPEPARSARAVPATAVRPSTPAPATAPAEADVDSTSDLEPAPTPYPQPIVLHVEPPIDSNDAGTQALENGAAGNGSSHAVAPVAASASAAPVASAAPAEEGVACGTARCAPGKVCCNASCGTCTAPGERCSQRVCGMNPLNESQSCGPATCNVGEVCCNASCGTCVRPGGTCDTTRRCSSEITFPESQSCGMQTCNVGLVCCNPSCGICAPPGEPCSQDACG